MSMYTQCIFSIWPMPVQMLNIEKEFLFYSVLKMDVKSFRSEIKETFKIVLLGGNVFIIVFLDY